MAGILSTLASLRDPDRNFDPAQAHSERLTQMFKFCVTELAHTCTEAPAATLTSTLPPCASLTTLPATPLSCCSPQWPVIWLAVDMPLKHDNTSCFGSRSCHRSSSGGTLLSAQIQNQTRAIPEWSERRVHPRKWTAHCQCNYTEHQFSSLFGGEPLSADTPGWAPHEGCVSREGCRRRIAAQLSEPVCRKIEAE